LRRNVLIKIEEACIKYNAKTLDIVEFWHCSAAVNKSTCKYRGKTNEGKKHEKVC
jgi:hypothetical protein